MFTTIIHPDDGRELQIKCGEDMCETYRVGDIVPWFVIKDWPESGYLLDDVYSSYSNNGDNDWVIIKDHVVLAVESKDESYGYLYDKYKIQKPARELWSEEAWIKYEEFKAELQKDHDEFEDSIKHLSAKEQAIQFFIRPLTRNYNYAEIAKSVFKIEPLPPGAASVYYMDPEDDDA